MKALKTHLTLESIKTFIWMNISVAILAAGIYFFKFPNNFTTGGVSGISVLLSALPIPLSGATIMFIINIAFLLLGFIFLGKSMGAKTIYCSIAFSFIIQFYEVIYPMTQAFTEQKMLELAFAIILPGVGSAILFSLGASSGGTDILALIIRKYTSIELGSALLFSDFIITASAIFFFGIETGLYSILGLVLKAFVVDNVIENISTKKIVIVISSYHEQIVDYITHDLQRGVTLWKCVGGFTGKEKTAILAVVTKFQSRNLRLFVRNIDPSAFIIINSSSEITGKGFIRGN